MRIALLAPLVSPIAPPFLGGAQALLADLATGLAARGHDVTLYAAPGSEVAGVRLVSLEIETALLRPARFVEAHEDATGERDAGDKGLEADENDDEGDDDPLAGADPDIFYPAYAFLTAYRAIARNARAHDLVHAHAYDWPAFSHANVQPLPVVHTLHLPAVDPEIRQALAILAPPASATPTRLVTVSRACAATYAPYCRIDAVIYNGVATQRIPFGAHPAAPPYLLYAGRITPEKGVEDALDIAARADRRLLLAGGIYDADYYKERIAPRLAQNGGQAEYLGPLPRERLWELMAGAEAVLCPVRWDEPFGLVACEALAAGAPVVGYARGGLREIVEDGVTGWLVAPGDVEAAVAAVRRAATLDRVRCRASIEQRFSLAAMLDAYEAFYATMRP